MQQLFFLIILLCSYQFIDNDQSLSDAQSIVNKSIKAHGGDHIESGRFEFDFRKYHFTYKRKGGAYEFSRTHNETKAKDILTNNGFNRMENGVEALLTEKEEKSLSNAVNSVQYFAFLPYYLNDSAVNKEYVGEVTIKGKSYHKIRVTFDQEGGGDDHDDVYVYWFDVKDYSMDYLAYSFQVNGGGVRFREAYNAREIGGVTFQDYVNYKHAKYTPVEDLDVLFEKGELVKLSEIELKNIKAI